MATCRLTLSELRDDWTGVEYPAWREVSRFSSGFRHLVDCLLGTEPEGRPVLFSMSSDGSHVARWDPETGEPAWRDGAGVSGCNAKALVCPSGGKQVLAIATEDGIEWWDARTGLRRTGFDREVGAIWAVAVDGTQEAGPLLLGVAHTDVVHRWDPATGEPMHGSTPTGRGPMTAVGFVAPSGGTGVVVSGDECGRVWRWDALTGERMGGPIQAHESQIAVIQGLPGTKEPMFVSSDHEGVLKRWNAVTGVEVGEPFGPGVGLYSVATARVGGTGVVFAAGADDLVRSWNADTGTPLGPSLEGRVVTAVTRQDGTALVATCTTEGEIAVYRSTRST